MDKNLAIQQIKETFENSFNKERFVNFTRELLNRIDGSKAFHARGYVKEKYKKSAGIIKTYERIGTYVDSDDNKIDVLIVYLEKDNSIERARTTLRNFVADYLKGRGEKDAALVAFVSPNLKDWRFSLVKMDYQLKKDKVKQEFTPARRFSFLVGENENSHTAQSQLVPILKDDINNPTLERLEEAFNIEIVTKEFFKKYRDLFLQLKDSLDDIIEKDKKIKQDFKNKKIDTVDFAKKILGQIVFLYFLQKKGWFGVKRGEKWGSGSKRFLRELFEKKHGNYKNFFNNVLEPLFYEALRLGRPKDYYDKFECRIPFLNGGLFDPLNDYDWQDTDILFPNEIFSNNNLTKEGDKGDGILDVFDRYNFTVKEDEPFEKEVAIDPEMLGKVFEKLGAISEDKFNEWAKAIRSGDKRKENDANKKLGVYYTPREIVHYMCQQSLINYLYTELNQTKEVFIEKDKEQGRLIGKPDPKQLKLSSKNKECISKEDIEKLIKYGEIIIEHDNRVVKKGKETNSYSFKFSKDIRDNAKLIDKKLASIRICDPAVGSGAFLIGMMNEIIRTRNILTSFLFFSCHSERSEESRTIYNLKRHAIQNCLYGVDIDSGAVEIAKLRLWLSLIVDEDDIKQIKPLPNLDYKIMIGNSLIELLSFKFLSKTTNQQRCELIDKFNLAKKKFFKITSSSEKDKRRVEINKLIREIFEYDRNFIINSLKQKIKSIQNQGRLFTDPKFEKDDRKQIKEIRDRINEFRKIKIPGPTDHFEWCINFSEVFDKKNGFDVVIANPPYVTTKYGKISESLKMAYVKIFESAYDKLDLYVLFIEKAIKISKEHGFTTFITPWNFLANFYSFKIRKFLLDNTKIKLFNKLSPKVFGSVIVDNIISIFEKDKNNQGNLILFDDLFDKRNQEYINQDDYLQNEKYVFTFTNDVIVNEILNKMKLNSMDLGKIALNYIGIMTGGQKEMIANNPIFKNSKPVLSGKDITRWTYFNRGNFVNFDKSKIHSNDNEKVYLSEKKILLRKTGRELVACIDKNQFFTIQSLYNIIVKNKQYTEEYLLSLLNSKLFTYIYNKFFITNPEVFPYIKRRNLDQLPIKVVSKSKQRIFIELVNKIFYIIKDDDYLENPIKQAKVHEYEKQIDQMVYKLYSLTKEEIKIIEAK